MHAVSNAAGQLHDAGYRRFEGGHHSLTAALQAGQSGGSAGCGYQPGLRGARVGSVLVSYVAVGAAVTVACGGLAGCVLRAVVGPAVPWCDRAD
eukprot:8861610-Pyramimonas_sp.AAC.1